MEMDEDKIGLVLVRAAELHSKIANSIHLNNKTHFHSHTHHQDDDDGDGNGNGDEDGDFDGDYDDVDQDNDTLLSICDAFDSLESLLTSLQTLQQQQRYEREAVIGDIENSRKMLLKKLSDYKGEHIDVIREAEIFAGMKVEHDNDLLLPPYPTRTPHSLVLDNKNVSRSLHARKLTQNGYNGSNDLKDELKNDQTRTSSSKLWGGLRFLIHSTAKTMLTLVGVVTLLNLAGFEPKINKKGANLNVLTLLQQPTTTRKKLMEQCPPGKVPVMEGGEFRCIVKERVEIPFDSVAENPDVNYGCG